MDAPGFEEQGMRVGFDIEGMDPRFREDDGDVVMSNAWKAFSRATRWSNLPLLPADANATDGMSLA